MTDKTPRREVLEEAADLIDGDRNVTYGAPTQNFTNIAELWSTAFRHRLKDGESFSASDVADALILLKVARNVVSKKRDNYVDIAGYAGCGWESHDAAPDAPSASDNHGYPPGIMPCSGKTPHIEVNFTGTQDVETTRNVIDEYMRKHRGGKI